MTLHRIALAALMFAAAPAFPAAAPAPDAQQADAHGAAGIDWHKGDVDSAFAQARNTGKPVFLYWGAVWCPPCNQVKATIFNRIGFIERSRGFVPVYLDGDSPDGQKLGARFKVRGYPTMILFKPDGTEITRLPGEVDGERYLGVLALAMNATRPVKETLKAALEGGAPAKAARLTANDWRMLADYSWDTDEQQLIAERDLPATLGKLAAAAPAGDAGRRLALKALVAAADPDADKQPGLNKAAARKRVAALLADARAARDNMDLLTNYADRLVEFLTDAESPGRTAFVRSYDGALRRLAQDAALSKADRMTALTARVLVARLDRPEGALDAALLNDVRKQVAATERATTDAYERQAVVSAAADALAEAGLLAESDALLTAELKRSHSPYYFMLGLAGNAKKRGDAAAALNWYEQAYRAAKGPATRLQWGVTYLNGLIDLAPQDDARIAQAANSVLTELGGTQDAFYERNRAALERLGRKLAQWNSDGRHEAALKTVGKQLAGICARLPAADVQRATCQKVLESTRARA
jgi:thiol-disulfide isomerase/thioredoxin